MDDDHSFMDLEETVNQNWNHRKRKKVSGSEKVSGLIQRSRFCNRRR